MQQTTPPASQQHRSDSPYGLRATVTWLTDENAPQASGARVVEPPRDTKQAVRGNLYAVLQLEGALPEDGGAGGRIGERVLSMLQRTYYTAKGSQSFVLAEAMRAALAVVREHNTTSPAAPLRLSLACASLLGHRLMVGCTGAAFMLLRREEQVELFPTEPDALHSVDPAAAPAVGVLRWEMEAGDAFLLCGPAWLDRVTVKMLAAVVYHLTPESAEEFAEGLREQAGGSVAPGLLVALESEGPPPPPRPQTPLTTPRRSPGALPTSLTAEPPVIAPPGTPRVEAHVERPTPQAEVEAEGASVTEEQFPAPQVQPAAPVADEPAAATPAFLTRESLEPTTADRIRQSAGMGVDKARSLFRQMLPDRREGEAAGDFEPMGPLPADAGQIAAAPVEEEPLAPAVEPVRPPAFAPPPPASGGRARVFIALAVVIALLVPVIVGAFFWQAEQTRRAEAETLLMLAQSRVASSQEALDMDDTRSSLVLLSEAEDYLDRSVELIGPTDAVDELRQMIRRVQSDATEVQPLYALTSPLVTLPSGSAATRLLVVDQDIYILDPGRGVIDRYRMDPSLETVPEQNGDVVLRTGDAVGGATVGALLDIAWQPVIPGYDDKATLLVLDDKNQIIRYDPRVEGPSVLELAGAETFGRLTQVESFTGRIYMADAGRGQLLRYPAGRYSELPPDDWFAAPLTLDELLSLRIDGDVWMLMRNGNVLQFNSGQQVAFSLDSSVGLMREPVDFVVGDGTNPYIYVADGGGESVWVFDKSGKYMRQLAAPEGNPLRGLSGIFIEDVTDSLFLLTSSALYKHPLPGE